MLIRMKSGDNHYVIGQSDINAVKNAGGLPVLIPVMNSTEDIPEQVTNIDALYIPGGPDINTLLFGEEPIIGMGSSRRSDDIYEMEIIRQAAAKNLPILGVCRGEQVINIAFGGTVEPSAVPDNTTASATLSKRSVNVDAINCFIRPEPRSTPSATSFADTTI